MINEGGEVCSICELVNFCAERMVAEGMEDEGDEMKNLM